MPQVLLRVEGANIEGFCVEGTVENIPDQFYLGHAAENHDTSNWVTQR